eukprot:5354455-Amphidinium_carterae.1
MLQRSRERPNDGSFREALPHLASPDIVGLRASIQQEPNGGVRLGYATGLSSDSSVLTQEGVRDDEV